MTRFSKAALRKYLVEKIERFELEHNFDPRNGWAQVDSKNTVTKVRYGEYTAYQRMLEDLDGGYIT